MRACFNHANGPLRKSHDSFRVMGQAKRQPPMIIDTWRELPVENCNNLDI